MLFSTWRITLSIYVLLISMKRHFKSILKGTIFWMHQRKQLADEDRLLEDGTHADTNFLEEHEASGARPWPPHRAHSADHIIWQQDSGRGAWFPFCPHCPPPSPMSPALSSVTRRPSLDFAFRSQKRDTEKGLQRFACISTGFSIFLAKLGHHTLCRKHNRLI